MPLFTGVPGETVWKFGIGPEWGSESSQEGSKESRFGCFLLPERRAEMPSAIFQTVSPRTPVNKAGQASSEALSDYTRGCRRYLRLHGVLLLLAMLARKVLRTVHNDHHDRHRAPQRCEQPRLPHRVSPREHRADETARDGVVHGVHQHEEQHAPVGIVEHPVEDDHKAQEEHNVRQVDLSYYH